MNIKYKIVAIVLFSSLIPFIIIGFFVYLNVQKSIQKIVIGDLSSRATIQKNRLLDFIRFNENELNASKLELRLEVDSYNKTGDKQSLDEVNNMLLETKNETPGFMQIHVLNLKGMIIASTQSNQIGTNHVQDQFYQKGLKQNETFLFFKTKDRQIRYYLTGPLVLNGKTIGIVVIEKSADDLFALFSDYTGLGQTGQWGLATHASNGDALIIVPGRLDKNSDSPLRSTLSKRFTHTPINLALRGTEASFPDLVNYLGIHVIAITRYIPQTDWGLGVTISQSEAYAPLTELSNHIVFFVALLILFVIFLGLSLSEIIVTPIKNLTKYTTELANANFTTTAATINIDSNSSDEVGILARSFNTMAEKLKALYQSLDQKVHERTAALDKSRKQLEKKINELEIKKEKAKEEKAKVEAILESIGDGLIVTDAKGIILRVNSIALNLLGYNSRELTGESIILLDMRDTTQKVLHLNKLEKIPFLQAVTQKRTINISANKPYFYKHKNGHFFPIAASVTPIFFKENVIGSVEVFRDVTEDFNINKAKDNFIAIASHDLLTPIAIIGGYLSMILSGKHGKVGSRIKWYLKEAITGVERMSVLVKKLLLTSKLDADVMQLELQKFDLKRQITSVCKEMDFKASQKGITMKIEGDSQVIVRADINQTKQVLTNLLDNAIKFTEKGCILIIINKDQQWAKVVVKDNGIGIDEHEIEHIFERFYWSKNWEKQQSESHGLGLYIAKSLLELMGGTITVESELKKGTTFTVSLPLAKI